MLRTWTDDQLQTAVATSRNMTQVLLALNLKPNAGGSATNVRKHLTRLGLSEEHFGSACRGFVRELHPSASGNDSLFVENSSTRRSVIRRRLVRVPDLLAYVCAICANPGHHFGKPLTLQLDHINGVPNDHRLENLRWLCPNCHSQTPTFAGRNTRTTRNSREVPRPNTCALCGKSAIKNRTFCSNRCSGLARRKTVWPKFRELKNLVDIRGYSGTGRLLGVSDVAVRKRLKLAEKDSNL